jgi:Flp pilus assembly protein TadD
LQEIGIPAARKLILLDDKDAESQDLMGWLLMKATDYTSAERFFHHALELDANFVQANYHLGQLYLLTNRRGDAYFHLSRVVAQLPEGEQIRISAERLLQP